ncbi:lymphocyte antigen 96 [Rhinophrynus dorsalis]
MDIHHLTGLVDIWRETIKVGEYQYILCSGVDDEYEFCGALKGETVRYSTARRFSLPPFHKGRYVMSIRVLAGDEDKMDFCCNVTLIVKV